MEDKVIRALNLFKCDKDSDIEEFLHSKAVDFIAKDICQVYLILDEDAFDSDIIKVEGYFTLSHRALRFNEDVSKTKRKNITGFKDREITEFVLIGQIEKYISAERHSDLSLNEILAYAFEVIEAASSLIPCRIALVECSEEIYKRKLYDNCGFVFLQQDRDFYQYYKLI